MHATQLMHSPIAYPLRYNEGHPNVTLPDYFKEGEEKVSLSQISFFSAADFKDFRSNKNEYKYKLFFHIMKASPE